MKRKNIFLDFMGPDMWKTIPSFGGKNSEKIKILSESLNIAVLLTAEYCILPPAFVAQAQITREVMQMKVDFLKNKLVLFPLKESSLEYYFEKKQREYNFVRESHSEFYKKAGQKFIGKHSAAIIHRESAMGGTIADKWKELSDTSELWLPITVGAPENADKIRETPSILKDKGISITLEAVKKEANIYDHELDFALNQAIQHEYLTTYLKEYDAVIVEDIPPKPVSFNYLVVTDSLFYNYYVFQDVLEVIGAADFLKNASAEMIVRIRRLPEYNEFLELYGRICEQAADRLEVRSYFLRLKRYVPASKLHFLFLNFIIGMNEEVRKFQNLLNALLDKSVDFPFDKELLNDKDKIIFGRDDENMVNKKIFIVHGHDMKVRDKVELFCRRIGLDPVILSEKASAGKTIIEKIEFYSEVSYALILYTGCDEGRTKGTGELHDRARQNVVFEHGYMVVKLGRNRVIALVDKGVEIPGDLSGVVYISLENSDWEIQVMRELENGGLKIAWSKA